MYTTRYHVLSFVSRIWMHGIRSQRYLFYEQLTWRLVQLLLYSRPPRDYEELSTTRTVRVFFHPSANPIHTGIHMWRNHFVSPNISMPTHGILVPPDFRPVTTGCSMLGSEPLLEVQIAEEVSVIHQILLTLDSYEDVPRTFFGTLFTPFCHFLFRRCYPGYAPTR